MVVIGEDNHVVTQLRIAEFQVCAGVWGVGRWPHGSWFVLVLVPSRSRIQGEEHFLRCFLGLGFEL